VLKSQFNTVAGLLRSAFVVSAVVLAAGSATDARERSTVNTSETTPAAVLEPTAWSGTTVGGIDQRVFKLALNAASCAVRSGKISNPSTLTVIDYSKPSTQKRMWVIDLKSRALLYEELVAHGSGSGDNMATRFSNDPETHRSSIGLFETGDTYIGKNGYSLRLVGLDAGFNDHAFDRAIVMHGAPYVSDSVAKKQGRLGRSWGCPAVRESVAHELIDRVKETGLVFAYYPDPKWLSASPFLGDCYGSGNGVTPTIAG
jgi:hypothetical protein